MAVREGAKDADPMIQATPGIVEPRARGPERAPPRHVAIIMDGNGRWAKMRGLPRIAGHRFGVEAVRDIVEGAIDQGVRWLTLYAFSSENWKRPPSEIDGLMLLLRRYLRKELAELHRNGVRVRFIGDRSGLARDLIALIEHAEARTLDNVKLNLTLAVNYGGQNEIVRAARAIAEAAAAGRVAPAEVTAEMFARHLQTADAPDPDLLIRTSGECRLSNFLLWQTAYSELVFVDTLWPDFKRAELAKAIDVFHRRNRRFGAAS